MTAERLREMLSYDPLTGVWTWRVRKSSSVYVGDVAGKINSKGYRLIGVDGRWHKAHRLAWLYMTGSWPREQIDHFNLIKNDNRFENLREATQTQNHANTRQETGPQGHHMEPPILGRAPKRPRAGRRA